MRVTVPTYIVSFVGGPLADTAGELRHLAPIGLDGGPMRGRGTYRWAETGPDGDVVFEWEPIEPGRRLIEPHLPELPDPRIKEVASAQVAPTTQHLSSLSGRPAEPQADASGGGPSAFPGAAA